MNPTFQNYRGITFSAGGAVQQAIQEAPDYHAGELEAIKARLNKLTDIFTEVLDKLPPDVQRDIVNSCTYGFTEVKYE